VERGPSGCCLRLGVAAHCDHFVGPLPPMLRGRLDSPATEKIEPVGLGGVRSAAHPVSSLPHLAVTLHIVSHAVGKACGVLCAKHYLSACFYQAQSLHSRTELHKTIAFQNRKLGH
jgi:hypothetical protein